MLELCPPQLFLLILRAISRSAGVDSSLSCRVKVIVSPPEPAIMERASLLFPTGSSDKKWVKTPESLSLGGRDFTDFFFFMPWFSFVFFFLLFFLSVHYFLPRWKYGESSNINSNYQHFRMSKSFKDLIVFSKGNITHPNTLTSSCQHHHK